MIAGTAPTAEGNLVHAVTVIQPVQTWTVIRSQGDFLTMHNNLATVLQGIPPCPSCDNLSGSLGGLIAARHQLQQWLLSVLLFPGARESPAIRTFLTDAANIIPPQYENASWTMFDADGQVVNPTPAPVPAPAPPPAGAPVPGSEFTMDMMMDDWGDDGGNQQEEAEEETDYRPSERYQLTNEPVSAQDEMEMANMAAEVEMIEDVGSLAQSLGASHLGRSLMLQDEMGGRSMQQYGIQHHQHGVNVGSAVSGRGGGGIGTAMENAPVGLGGSFTRTTPESPPRLDSFKMLKVIGKGSFGTLYPSFLLMTCQMFSHYPR